MGKHEEHRIANTVVKIGFRRFGAGEKVVAVDIHNATAATMKRSGKKWNALFALETNEPKTGGGAVRSEAQR